MEEAGRGCHTGREHMSLLPSLPEILARAVFGLGFLVQKIAQPAILICLLAFLCSTLMQAKNSEP